MTHIETFKLLNYELFHNKFQHVLFFLLKFDFFFF